ncbi:hypothetical protein ACWC9T_11395 [Kitasatospora sp. NPDC001159]
MRGGTGARATEAGTALQGEARAVLARHGQALRVMARFGGPGSGALRVRSRLHVDRGNPAAALARLLECGAQERRAQVSNLSMAPWRSRAALLHLALGQRTDALQLATAELELAHRWGSERVIGVASRCLGARLVPRPHRRPPRVGVTQAWWSGRQRG